MNRWIPLLIVCVVLARSLVFAWVTLHPDPYCFGYELGLGLLGSVIAPLAAAFVCGLVLAWARAPITTYLLLAASLSIVSAIGFLVGLTSDTTTVRHRPRWIVA